MILIPRLEPYAGQNDVDIYSQIGRLNPPHLSRNHKSSRSFPEVSA